MPRYEQVRPILRWEIEWQRAIGLRPTAEYACGHLLEVRREHVPRYYDASLTAFRHYNTKDRLRVARKAVDAANKENKR